ncbi:MAG: hypothetical protein ACREJ2_17540, partial [Planctomycetota bacterium]
MAATAHSIRRKPVRLKPSDFHPVTLPGAVAGASRVQNGALTARFGAAVGAQIHWRAELPEVARWPAVELRVAGAVTHGRVPATAVVARILWKNAAGELLAHETQEYIPHRSLYGPPSRREPWPAGQGEFALHDIRAVPQGARRAELILA